MYLERRLIMRLCFGGHWLAFLWTVASGQGNLLKEAVAKAKSAKASVFELIYALNGMRASETAQALKDGGMNRAIICVFFPDGEKDAAPPMGDPLSDNDSLFQRAVDTFREALMFITQLQMVGIKIDLIVGPSCWVLGKEYNLPQEELNRRILRFYKALEQDLKTADVRVAIELLRGGEDHVIRKIDNAIDIIDALNSIVGSRFGFHYDSFHFDERQFKQDVCIRRLGNRIMHLHINGSGRRPAGGEGDTINWTGQNGILTGLKEVGVDGCVATNEPFCALVRQSCAPLGAGLPDPVEEPDGMNITRQMLEKNGVEIIQ